MGRPPPLHVIISCRDPRRPSLLWKINTRQQRPNDHSFIQQCILRPVGWKASGYAQSTRLWFMKWIIYCERQVIQKNPIYVNYKFWNSMWERKLVLSRRTPGELKKGKELFWFLVKTLKGRVIEVETWQMERDKLCKQHVKSTLNHQWTWAEAQSREATCCVFWQEGCRLILEI